MQESTFTNYDQLPLFLNANTVAQALGVSLRDAAGNELPFGGAALERLCAVDVSGRGALGWAMDLPSAKVGAFDTELVKEFWLAFTRTLGASIHFRQLAGENSHHIIEAMFKGAGRALKQAVAIDHEYADEVPSTKGVL